MLSSNDNGLARFSFLFLFLFLFFWEKKKKNRLRPDCGLLLLPDASFPSVVKARPSGVCVCGVGGVLGGMVLDE